jgi:catechol 2,3-dioxygenase-like lactoylglutathione lyase family enzyme
VVPVSEEYDGLRDDEYDSEEYDSEGYDSGEYAEGGVGGMEGIEFSVGPILGWAVLGVQNVEATSDYYREVLGFPIDFMFGDPPVHAGGSSNLHFARGKTVLCFVVSDLDSLHDNYQSSGAKIIAKPYLNQDSGMREMDVEDCNGYVLRFSQLLHDANEEDGACNYQACQ